MATAKIICDASFTKGDELCGYAGGILIESNGHEWVDLYHGIYPDCVSSDHGEMRAIAMGGKRLSKIARQHNITIDNIAVYTDSKNSIDQYELFCNGKQHQHKFTEQLVDMRRFLGNQNTGSALTINKVKAHVPDDIATPYEKLHNMIDKNAVSVRLKAFDHIFYPDIDKSQFYAVLLTDNPNVEHHQSLRAIGYHHASKGMIARVAIPGVNKNIKSHPFYDGIAQYAKLAGKDPDSLIQKMKWDRSGDVNASCIGMDKTSVLIHEGKRLNGKVGRVDIESPAYLNASVASRLLYGHQYQKKYNETHLTGRLENASKFVLNLFHSPKEEVNRPFHISEWIDKYTSYVNIPRVNGLAASMRVSNIPKGLPIKDPYRGTKQSINNIVRNFSGDITSEQLVNKVLDSVHKTSGINCETLGSEMVNICERNQNHEVRLIKQLSQTILRAVHEGSSIEPGVIIEDVRSNVSQVPDVEPRQKLSLGVR